MANDELIARYIEENPHRPGADEVRLIDFGISVWALIGYLHAVGNVRQVADDYGVPVEAVSAAIAYYEQHQDIINARLAANVPSAV